MRGATKNGEAGDNVPRRPDGTRVDIVDVRRNERLIDEVDWRLVRSSVRSRSYGKRGVDGMLDLGIERRVQDRILDERLAAMGPRPVGGWKLPADSEWAK
jgi:hypothetical protein